MPILGVYNALIHFILNLFPGPSNSLKGRPHTNGSSLTNHLGERHSRAQGSFPSLSENIRAVALIFRNNLDKAISDTEEVSLGARDSAAGQDEIAGSRKADEGWQTVGATRTGDDSETGFRKTDCGIGGEDAEVGGEGELEAAAEG